jgi:hypothetical protein
MASEKVMRGLCIVLVFGVCGLVKADGITDFEDLTLGPESYWNGSDGSGGFHSGNAWFNNNYDATYGSWNGFSYSNITDTASSGWTSQYNAITGSGQGGSAKYAVGYGYGEWGSLPTMTLDEPTVISGLYVTNNNYAYYSMLYGDAFAKKFGGESGDDADWFLLTMMGRDVGGAITGTVEFYLADFRFADNGMDYIVNTWQFVDLTSLGAVKSVEFGLSSSDVGDWGMNTPAYFVIDTVVPEPGTFVLLGFGVMGVIRRRKK